MKTTWTTHSWQPVYKCFGCLKKLDTYQRERYNGVCPLCGFATNGNVCKTLKDSEWVEEKHSIFDFIIVIGYLILLVYLISQGCKSF